MNSPWDHTAHSVMPYQHNYCPYSSTLPLKVIRQNNLQPVLRPSHSLQLGLSEVYFKRDKFMVKLDVSSFSPDELVVKTLDDFLLVEGSHDEKQDDHGFITRSFKRRYVLPPNVETEETLCEIGSDGVLVISLKIKLPEGGGNERVHVIKH